MTAQQILKEMESLGTAQNRKVYKRHGVNREMYGMSFANLKAMAKKVKADKKLLDQLWKTGNHDVRIFTTMIIAAALIEGISLFALIICLLAVMR